MNGCYFNAIMIMSSNSSLSLLLPYLALLKSFFSLLPVAAAVEYWRPGLVVVVALVVVVVERF